MGNANEPKTKQNKKKNGCMQIYTFMRKSEYETFFFIFLFKFMMIPNVLYNFFRL